MLDEAKTWAPDQQINWTELAGRWGQTVKEFLESQGVQAAMTKCQVIRRVKLSLPGGEVTYPTHMTVAAQKRTLLQKIKEGDILMRELIAPITFKKIVVNKSTKTITETEITIHGRHILE